MSTDIERFLAQLTPAQEALGVLKDIKALLEKLLARADSWQVPPGVDIAEAITNTWPEPPGVDIADAITNVTPMASPLMALVKSKVKK